ncbi:MAG: DNA polymerase I [Patescibacteria group bacterium]|nr:DNA polymerase I [Patescibacteria group bacterium]
MSANPKSEKKALLVDANALIHRAWHALPPMTNDKGELVNAAYGFASVMIKILGEQRPDVLAVCWDTKAPTFRHEAREDYKAQRVKQPDEFYAQIPFAQKIVEAMGGTNVSLDGFEADDILGTLAVRLEKKSYEVSILTGDRDAWQLISDHISVIAFKKGVSETVVYTPESLVEITGLRPDQIADYKAMRGDPSDNLPGISGIGEKTATDLLKQYDNLKKIFKAAHDPKSKMADGVRAKLIAGEKIAAEMLPLVRIVTTVPIKVEDKDLKRRLVNENEILEVFSELGFKSLITRLFGKKTNSPFASPLDKGGSKTASLTEVPARIASESVAGRRGGGIKKGGTAQNVSDLKDFLALASGENPIIIYIPESAQTSFFEQPAGLMLGITGKTLILPQEILAKKEVMAELKNILADEKIKKVGHDIKRACHWAIEHGLEIKNIGFDTQLASYLLSAGERSHDLKTMAGMYLKRVLDEGQAQQDIAAINDLVPVLKQELASRNLTSVLENIELPLITILAHMEEEGILVDTSYLKELAKELSKDKQALEKKMHDMAGEAFNPLSPKQLSHILFDVLEISDKGIKHGKTGISTAASELEKLYGTHPIIELIEQYRELSKLLSTYVEALPLQADKQGRVHTTFNQAVTATGRLSSSDPNLQNIPIRSELGRKVRRAFLSKPGFVLLSCDYSQIELRIAAALAKDKNMLEAFEKGEDIHTATAAKIWNLKLEDVTKDQRRIAKAINFGLIFGQGPQGLSRTSGISFEDAKKFIARYFEVFSGIKEWMEWSKGIASQQGYVETLFGRRRFLPEIHSFVHQVKAQAERMAINMPIQGTEADLIKMAMIKIAEQLPLISKNSKMLLQVHDELVFEVPEKEVKVVAPQLVDIMQNIEKIGCPIIVDAKFGKNWEEMTKL